MLIRQDNIQPEVELVGQSHPSTSCQFDVQTASAYAGPCANLTDTSEDHQRSTMRGQKHGHNSGSDDHMVIRGLKGERGLDIQDPQYLQTREASFTEPNIIVSFI